MTENEIGAGSVEGPKRYSCGNCSELLDEYTVPCPVCGSRDTVTTEAMPPTGSVETPFDHTAQKKKKLFGFTRLRSKLSLIGLVVSLLSTVFLAFEYLYGFKEKLIEEGKDDAVLLTMLFWSLIGYLLLGSIMTLVGFIRDRVEHSRRGQTST